MSSHHVYFDLDGTLTDPFVGISRCIVYALEMLGAVVPDDDDLKQYIGPPLMDTFTELIDSGSAADALALYRERFDEVGWKENMPYDGVHAALDTLRGAGATLFVATTKPWVFAERIVEHFGMNEFFCKVYGSELDGTRTDKTELLAYALAENRPSQHATMVGDRKHDVIGAINNDIDIVGVLYGYGSLQELHQAGAEQIAATPSAIPDLVL
jgi:phosphoglycolate phosphatase